MVQIDFGKEFARGEGHIHGNLSKVPQCGHTSIGIKKKKVSFFLPLPKWSDPSKILIALVPNFLQRRN